MHLPGIHRIPHRQPPGSRAGQHEVSAVAAVPVIAQNFAAGATHFHIHGAGWQQQPAVMTATSMCQSVPSTTAGTSTVTSCPPLRNSRGSRTVSRASTWLSSARSFCSTPCFWVKERTLESSVNWAGKQENRGRSLRAPATGSSRAAAVRTWRSGRPASPRHVGPEGSRRRRSYTGVGAVAGTRSSSSTPPAWPLAVLKPISVPSRLARPHTVVQTMQSETQPLGLTKPVQGRALRLIQALITAAEAIGHSTSAGRTGFTLRVPINHPRRSGS